MSSLKIFLILLLLLSIFSVDAYFCSEIKINSNNPEKTISFNINKVSNSTYTITFTHFGNIKNYTTIKIYLNNQLIYTISKSNNNTGSGRYKKSTSINITNYLNNGKNTLKMVGNNMGALNYTPYYKLQNIYINEPIKTPIPTSAIILSILAVFFVAFNNKK